MNTPLAAILACYLLGIFALSIYASRRITTEEDYVVAGRKLPLWLAWGTLVATWFGAATILGAAEAARSEGVRGTLLDPFASGLSLILAGLFFAGPLWDMKLLTMGDFFGRIYGPRAELVASCVLIPGYFGWIGAQFVALAGLQHSFFAIPPGWGIIIGATLILAYTLIGGMWSVTMTDTCQLVVLLIGVVILAVSVFGQIGDGSAAAGIGRLFRETDARLLTFLPGPGVVAGMAWLATLSSGFFGNIPGQDLMQRVFSSKDARTAKLACILAGIAYLAFGLLPVGMGLASRILIPEDRQGTILSLLAEQFLSPLLTPVFVVSLVSIIVSTATSAVLAPATILGHNLLARLRPFQRNKLFVERLSVGLMVLGGVAMAFTGDTILGLLEMSVATVLVGLFVPLVTGLYGRPRSEWSALLAIGLGSAAWLLRELFEGLLCPMPEALAATGTAFADYIANQFPPHVSGRLLSGTVYAFAVVPAALQGLCASVAGYLIGQQFGGLQPPSAKRP